MEPVQARNFWWMLTSSDLFTTIILIIIGVISVFAWAVVIKKIGEFKGVWRGYRWLTRNMRGRSFNEIISLRLPRKNNPFANLLDAMRFEYNPDSSSLVARLHEVENRVVVEELEHFSRGLDILASAASASPFLGLLGTVWGISKAFLNIGLHGSTSIVVVGPGLAAALTTTLVGLIAAIPALLFYNYFTKQTASLEAKMHEVASKMILLASREEKG